MSQFSGKTALITGASSGIGEAFAHLLAEQGANLILVARREDKLEALSQQLVQKFGISTTVVAKDLSLPGAAETLFNSTSAMGLSVDVLINNAGNGNHGEFLDISLSAHQKMVQLNVNTLMDLTYYYAEAMKQTGGGHILLVASIAGFLPIPEFATYAASKAFVFSFGQSLSKELMAHNIKVTALCPGGTATEFMDVAGQRIDGIRQHALMSSEAVANAGLQALIKGKGFVVPGFLYKFSMASLRFLPRNLQMWFGTVSTR